MKKTLSKTSIFHYCCGKWRLREKFYQPIHVSDRIYFQFWVLHGLYRYSRKDIPKIWNWTTFFNRWIRINQNYWVRDLKSEWIVIVFMKILSVSTFDNIFLGVQFHSTHAYKRFRFWNLYKSLNIHTKIVFNDFFLFSSWFFMIDIENQFREQFFFLKPNFWRVVWWHTLIVCYIESNCV